MTVAVTRDEVLRAAGDDPRPGPPHADVHGVAASATSSLKAELFQKTGSFKVRGVLNKLSVALAGGARRAA